MFKINISLVIEIVRWCDTYHIKDQSLLYHSINVWYRWHNFYVRQNFDWKYKYHLCSTIACIYVNAQVMKCLKLYISSYRNS